MDAQLTVQMLDLMEKMSRRLDQPATNAFGVKHTLGALASDADHQPLYDNAFFQDCTLEAALGNTLILPSDSILNDLPVEGTIYDDESYGFLTAFTAAADDTSTDPDATGCDPCLTVTSSYDFCKISLPFGRVCRDTKTYESNKLMRKACARQYDDFFIANIGDTPRGISLRPSSDFGQPHTRNMVIQSAVMRGMSEIMKDYYDKLTQLVWTGDPANNIGDAYAEPWGLESLVNGDYPASGLPLTTQAGALTSCAGLNSDIKDFGGECIGGGVNSIFEYLKTLERTIYDRARKTKNVPVVLKWYMNSELWTAITEALPCEYFGNGCVGGTVNANDGGNGLANAMMTAELQQTQRLTLNGRTWQVGFDDQIPFTRPTATSIQSDIYLLPLSVAGQPTLFIKHVDYSMLGSETIFDGLAGRDNGGFGWSDGGRYHWVVTSEGFCFKATSKVEPKIILTAPHLSGKIMDVQACPLQAAPQYRDGAGGLSNELAG